MGSSLPATTKHPVSDENAGSPTSRNTGSLRVGDFRQGLFNRSFVSSHPRHKRISSTLALSKINIRTHCIASFDQAICQAKPSPFPNPHYRLAVSHCHDKLSAPLRLKSPANSRQSHHSAATQLHRCTRVDLTVVPFSSLSSFEDLRNKHRVLHTHSPPSSDLHFTVASKPQGSSVPVYLRHSVRRSTVHPCTGQFVHEQHPEATPLSLRNIDIGTTGKGSHDRPRQETVYATGTLHSLSLNNAAYFPNKDKDIGFIPYAKQHSKYYQQSKTSSQYSCETDYFCEGHISRDESRFQWAGMGRGLLLA